MQVSGINNVKFNQITRATRFAKINQKSTNKISNPLLSNIIPKSDKFKIGEKLLNKITNLKSPDGNKIFDDKKLNLLSEVSKLPDKGFYHAVMSNLDSLEEFGKRDICDIFGDELMDEYYMKAKTPKGVLEYTTVPEDDYSSIKITNGNFSEHTLRKFKQDEIIDEVQTLIDNKVKTKLRVVHDLNKNVISKSKFNGYKGPIEEHSSLKFSNGLLESSSKTKFTQTNNQTRTTTISNDYKNHGIITAKGVSPAHYEMSELIKTWQNPYTGKNEKITMTPSQVNGVLNSVVTDDMGNKFIESYGNKYPDGSIKVEQHYTSLDGTKTDYVYKSKPSKPNGYTILDNNEAILSTNQKDNTETIKYKIYDKYGNTIKYGRTANEKLKETLAYPEEFELSYKITDKDGQILTSIKRDYKRISPTIAQSSVNGNKYTIVKKDNQILEVTDHSKNETTTVDLKKLYAYPVHLINNHIIENLSGDMILDLYSKGYRYMPISNINEAGIFPAFKTIHVMDKDLRTFGHELGHIKDYKNITSKITTSELSNNPEFMNTYKKEKLIFEKNMSQLEQDSIYYFINNKHPNYGKENGGPIETLAEINSMISSTPQTEDTILSMRAYYLQKYFPQTISKAVRLLNPHSNINIM